MYKMENKAKMFASHGQSFIHACFRTFASYTTVNTVAKHNPYFTRSETFTISIILTSIKPPVRSRSYSMLVMAESVPRMVVDNLIYLVDMAEYVGSHNRVLQPVSGIVGTFHRKYRTDATNYLFWQLITADTIYNIF